ncbi:putative kinase-like protein TMKL1 [Tanacetum coccineum]
MEDIYKLMLIVALSSSFALLIIVALACICKRKWSSKNEPWDQESIYEDEEMDMKGGLIKFEGGEDLSSFDVLDAPGEVIGKSSYGTLYRAIWLDVDLLWCYVVRPPCTGKIQDVMHVVKILGSVRHPNLVPLCGFYVGSRGEKLMVHPFYRRGNLAQFIRCITVYSV